MSAQRRLVGRSRALVVILWIIGALVMGFAFGGLSLKDIFFGH
jgi:hypothetical protein